MAPTPSVGQSSPKMMLVIALLVAVFAAAVVDVTIPINIVDIAETFNILPGTVSQLDSIIAIAAVTTALLLGAFGTKFRYKSLVMIGILFIAAYAIGLFLAPTFPIIQLIGPLNGIGSVLIVVTAQTFIGNSYPLDKKAKALGWISAAGTLANAVGAPIIGFMTGIGEWRSALLWFMLPITVISLIFVFLAFPLNLPAQQLNTKKESFLRGFNQILTNKSAVACLVSVFLTSAAVFGGNVFEVTLYRQIFSASPSFATLIGPTMGIALITVGAVIGGHIVNRVGRKRLTLVTTLLAGMVTLLSYFVPDLWMRVSLRWTASILGGTSIAAFANLTIEQVPLFRGTTMSLSSAFSGVGTAVGISIAGAVLNFYVTPSTGFQALGLAMNVFIIAAVLVTFFFAKDPIKTRDSQLGLGTTSSGKK
jgi:predicted MFS family arabinose efflux permease